MYPWLDSPVSQPERRGQEKEDLGEEDLGLNRPCLLILDGNGDPEGPQLKKDSAIMLRRFATLCPDA